ncbi:hypothetical protein [Mycoplasmopsis glycophila]|uniref:Uncharacterized protein n=1 Tax=Mycoplasmopsis glycophila TaxID=171285 RepID=A0A449AWM5_9BACT|nr:hypothetical protein [Mycoplasmopsis glycophila]VEU71135.1 Uncharacterised protein [Mycoplasmopsis glycophila]
MSNYYRKFKTNINKIDFYVLVSLLAALMFTLTIWVIIPFTLGVNEEYLKANGIDPNSINKENNEATSLTSLTLLSYIANAFVILFFLAYLFWAARKVKVGYIFYLSWIFIFITLAFIPFIKGVKILHTWQLGTGICISIFSSCISIALAISLVKYHMERKIHYYEWFKIHRQKGR